MPTVSGTVNACIVFMWMTNDRVDFTTGAMAVLSRSI